MPYAGPYYLQVELETEKQELMTAETISEEDWKEIEVPIPETGMCGILVIY